MRTGAAIKDDNRTAIRAYFHAGGVASGADRLRTGRRERAARAPEADSHRFPPVSCAIVSAIALVCRFDGLGTVDTLPPEAAPISRAHSKHSHAPRENPAIEQPTGAHLPTDPRQSGRRQEIGERTRQYSRGLFQADSGQGDIQTVRAVRLVPGNGKIRSDRILRQDSRGQRLRYSAGVLDFSKNKLAASPCWSDRALPPGQETGSCQGYFRRIP